LPGAISGSFGMLPTAGYAMSDTIVVDRARGQERIGIPRHMTTWIDANYFRTAGIALSAGRTPHRGATDEPPLGPRPPAGPAGSRLRTSMATPPVNRMLSEEIVVNRALARRIDPSGNVVGMRLRTISGDDNPGPVNEVWSTIVGVADDVHLPGAHGDVEDFQVYSLATRLLTTFVVRFSTVPPNVESVLRRGVQSVHPTLLARRARIADDYLREALAPTRFMLALLGTFAGVALVLAVVGLYGSIAYSVTQRTREIGIRIALGASSKAVTRLVVGDGVRLAVIGLVVGVGTAVAATRALSSLLYGVTAGDPTTFALIGGLVAVVALAASYLPARRAVRVDPVDALRAE